MIFHLILQQSKAIHSPSPRQLQAPSLGLITDLDEIAPCQSIHSPSPWQLPVLSLNPTSNISDDPSQKDMQSMNIRLSGIPF